MIALELTEREFRIVRLSIAMCLDKLINHDPEALATLVKKFVEILHEQKGVKE